MKITSLQVDGFGVWSKLKLEGLGEDLNVLYGPNEAGKTTLLQFVRSVLYGYAAERQKYLPPLHGGKAGGSLELATPNGQFQLDRHYEDNDEQITLSAADGTRQGEHLVKVLLSEVDESIFNNVFAVGLSEIQELGTLGGTEAAELLYNLTAGMDRISLVEVMRELENSRNSILDREGGPCRMTQLIERREKLRGEIEELGKLTRRYGRLAAEDKQLKREIARLEEEHAQAEHQSRVVELAVSLRERWQQRDELDEQLAALGPGRELPVGAIDRFDELNERIENHASRIKQRDAQQKQIKRDAAGLRINKPLWRQAARIEALSEQQAWLAGLQTQVADLEKENAQRQTELDNELKQLGIGGDGKSGPTPSLSRRRMPALRTPARAMKECRRRLQEAERAAAQSAEEAQSLSRQVETAIAGKGSGDLSTLMEKAADRAASFRRRLQIDERLDQLLRYRKEQEQRGEELLDKQMLPGWVLAAFGVVFALGFMLVIVGMFMPASFTGSLGWALAGLGVVGCGGAVAGKMMMERSNDRQLMACEKQLDMLEMQIEEAERERDALDAKLPGGGGPIASRLEAAEGELAALEELVPVDARRSSAAQDAQATAARVEDARRDLSAARHGWREALRSSGLPENFTPSQVKQVLSRNDHVDQLRQHLARNSEELEHRRGELDSLLGRITQLAAETGMESAGSPPLVQLRLLCEAVAEQESRVKQRRQLKQRLRKVRHNRAKHEEALGRLKSRRRELLRECDVEDEQTLRHRAAQFAKTEVLRRQRETLSKEIETAVGGHCPQQAIAEQLAGDAADKLETRWEQLAERSQSFQKELGQRFQRRGQLAEQLKNLADDRRMAGKQLEMAMLEKRIKETAQRWQTLAVTSLTLEKIREIYEQQRQPETLKEASQYLDALTRGRYCRVWTPLGEDVLRVDDARETCCPSRCSAGELASSCSSVCGWPWPLRTSAGERPCRWCWTTCWSTSTPIGQRRPPPCCGISPPRGINCSCSHATNTS